MKIGVLRRMRIKENDEAISSRSDYGRGHLVLGK